MNKELSSISGIQAQEDPIYQADLDLLMFLMSLDPEDIEAKLPSVDVM